MGLRIEHRMLMTNEVVIKLKALKNAVQSVVSSNTSRYIPFENAIDFFSRYKKYSDILCSQYPELFNDLPKRGVPEHELIESKKYIGVTELQLLLTDIENCLELLSSGIISMQVTREGIFFAGQYFDAIQCINGILSNAKKNIVIIDGYIDKDTLNLLSSKNKGVEVKILTKSITPSLKTLANSFNKQWGKLSIRTSNVFHDRFILIDDIDFYHFGASIKNAGNKGFMFSRIEEPIVMKALMDNFTKEWSKATVEV